MTRFAVPEVVVGVVVVALSKSKQRPKRATAAMMRLSKQSCNKGAFVASNPLVNTALSRDAGRIPPKIASARRCTAAAVDHVAASVNTAASSVVVVVGGGSSEGGKSETGTASNTLTSSEHAE
jgi:hypothetical protein